LGRGLGFWSVVPLVDPGRFLGWVVLIPLGEHGPGTEIGWRFVRNAWGHGYATEAARRILQRGFEIVGLSDIVAGMHAENERSRRLALRIGLSPAEPRMASSKGGALFRLSREDFTQLRGPPRQNLR